MAMAKASLRTMTEELSNCDVNIMGFIMCGWGSDTIPYPSVFVRQMSEERWNAIASVQYTSSESGMYDNPISISNNDELTVIFIRQNYWTTNSTDSK